MNNVAMIRTKEEKAVAVKNIGEKFICQTCGNEVVVTAVGGGTLSCCGHKMKRLENKVNIPHVSGP